MTGRWVVTGLGVVTAAGDTPEEVMAALVRGRPLSATHGDDEFPTAAIEGFDAKRRLPRKGVKDLSRLSQLACSAAVANAGNLDGVAAEEIGVVFGTAWGSLDTVIEFDRQAHLQGPRFVDPILFTETVSNIPAGQVAIFFGWSAFNATVSAGSASGLAGLQTALEFLDEGRGRVAVAGGGDALSVRLLRAMRARGATSRSDSLPLAAGRSGRIGGEGACFLTLESEEHAGRRAAPAMARVDATARGFFPHDAHADRPGIAAPIAGLIRDLLSQADLSPRDIDVIVLSASGEVAGDLLEGSAVIDIFGDGDDAPWIVAPKAVLGETWGASGALASLVGVEILRSGVIPGAPRGFLPDPALAGLRIPAETSHRQVRRILVLDGSEHGQELGLVLSAVDRDGDRS